VNKKSLALTLGAVITSIAILFSACRKINASTELGADLIPAVDNITTFDTTIDIQAYNDTFGIANDSTTFSASNEAFLGLINNDPFFGKTDARLFFELKPSSYPYYFVANVSPANLHIDSVVLVLDYHDSYGDTTMQQTVNVYEIDQSGNFRPDSTNFLRENDFTYSNLLGSKTFLPGSLNDSVFARMDTTKNQLRIKLDNSFGDRLLHYDSTSSSISGAYASDSLFRTKFKGFALQSIGSGNAVMGFALTGSNTKLGIYYSYPKTSGTGDTTSINYFNFTSFSSSTNYIKRDYNGTAVAAAAKGTTPAPFVYIQNTPGSFATIKIPDLANLSNRVVHRAELIAEEVYDPSDITFPVPIYLYLDAYDPGISKYRIIPYDLAYDPSSFSANLGSFGAFPVNAVDGSGNPIKVWHINISRYVQHVLTHILPLYDFRLYAPFHVLTRYGIPPDAFAAIFPVNPTTVKGRVRLAGGVSGSQRLRLHIIYSRL
jgi:Domain of unknown function (DUF4270)